MSFIFRHLRSDIYSYYSQKSVGDLKSQLHELFDNKWHAVANNLTGDFTSDNEFQATKKFSATFSKNGSFGWTKLKCKIYTDSDKTVIDIIVKPNPGLYGLTFIPPMFALVIMYSIIVYSTKDIVVAIISIAILFVLPLVERFYGQVAKNELKNTFVNTFNLDNAPPSPPL